MDKISMGKKIKEVREARGYTQERLAELCGYTSISSIAKIESGKSGISTEKLITLSSALSVEIEYLINDYK